MTTFWMGFLMGVVIAITIKTIWDLWVFPAIKNYVHRRYLNSCTERFSLCLDCAEHNICPRYDKHWEGKI